MFESSEVIAQAFEIELHSLAFDLDLDWPRRCFEPGGLRPQACAALTAASKKLQYLQIEVFDCVGFRTTTTGEQIALGFVWVKNEVMAFD